MRDFELKDNRVTLYDLVKFKNHTATQYRRKVRKSCLCKYEWARKVRALIWMVAGL